MAQKIIDDANELAREFYAAHGYEVAAGYRFDKANHPQEKLMWHLAKIAFEFVEGTDVEEALRELEED